MIVVVVGDAGVGVVVGDAAGVGMSLKSKLVSEKGSWGEAGSALLWRETSFVVLDGAGVGLVVVVRDVNVKAAVSLSSVGWVVVEGRSSG